MIEADKVHGESLGLVAEPSETQVFADVLSFNKSKEHFCLFPSNSQRSAVLLLQIHYSTCV